MATPDIGREFYPVQGNLSDQLRSARNSALQDRDYRSYEDKVQGIFKRVLTLIVIVGTLTGSWMLLGSAATIPIALSILLIGYIAWKRERRNQMQYMRE